MATKSVLPNLAAAKATLANLGINPSCAYNNSTKNPGIRQLHVLIAAKGRGIYTGVQIRKAYLNFCWLNVYYRSH
jgi:hypothetical protein